MDTLTKQDNEIVYSGFKLLKHGLEAIGSPTFEQWQECGLFIRKANSSVKFWIGDWIRYGKNTYGEKYSQAIDETGLEYGTLRNIVYVTENVDLSRRRDKLSFEHHAEVASFTPEQQEELLEKASAINMTVKDFRKTKHKLLLDNVRPSTTTDENLLLGDCVKLLQELPDGSIDCVVTDPPYGIDYQSNRREVKEQLDKIAGDKDEAFQLLDDVCNLLADKVKINSHLYFFTSWKVYAQFETIIGKYFDIKNCIVWDKGNHGAGDLEGNYGERHELIIFATKGRRILNGDRPDNIILYNKVQDLIHPTQKPVGLLEQLIKHSTDEGELVCDPFMGVGSTCKAAKNAGRKYLGMEIDTSYYELAKKLIWE